MNVPDDARDRDIAQRTMNGESTRSLAERYGINTRTVTRIRHRQGVAKPPPVRLSTDEIALAKRLLEDGASYHEVARTLGRGYWSVRRKFPGMSQWNTRNAVQMRTLLAQLTRIEHT